MGPLPRTGAALGTSAASARPLSAEDLSILGLENDTVVGHTCKVMLLEAPVGVERLRASIGARLPGAPLLQTRLVTRGGRSMWEHHDVDIDRHVVEHEAAAPDDAALRVLVAGLFAQRLDRSLPLWRLDVVPRLAGGSVLVWRIHHALADGSTAMRLAHGVLWDAAPPEDGPAAVPRRPGTGGAHARRHRLRGTLAVSARELPQPWRSSPLDGRISAARSVAFAHVELAALHQVAAAAGATVNDAVLTVVAGGLRRWLEAHHGHLGAIRVKVPVSLHAAPAAPDDGPVDAGNRDSFFCLDLPLGTADPLERLATIHRATRARKDGHDAETLDALMRRLAHAPPLRALAERALAHPRSFALNVSNVPGPRQPVAVLGIPVNALYSLAEIRPHHTLRVAVASMAGTLSFGLVADPTLLEDVDHLAADMELEAVALIALGA